MAETKQLFSSPRCQHVHYSGRPCKAPARRGRNYCVFHQAAHLDPGGCVLPVVEDLHSYHLAIIRIARALADDLIDPRKATALLYAMQLVGAKIEAFANQRAEIEDPTASLKKEISERYDARRYPFPLHVPEKDLLAILRDLRNESDRNADVSPATLQPTPIILSDDTQAEESKDPAFPPRTSASPAVDPEPGVIDQIDACAAPSTAGGPLKPSFGLSGDGKWVPSLTGLEEILGNVYPGLKSWGTLGRPYGTRSIPVLQWRATFRRAYAVP